MKMRVRFTLIALGTVFGIGAAPAWAGTKYALLVGVGAYSDRSIQSLNAPPNDVVVMAGVAERLGVRRSAITVLTTSLNPALTSLKSSGIPTRAAILAALDALTRRVHAGDQALIYISSHGTQVPDQPEGTPGHDEVDGWDEVVLPADAAGWNEETHQVRNGILDDEIGDYVDKIRAKGAAVWLVIDSCHSGTGMRGAEPSPYREYKGVDPAALGVPRTATPVGTLQPSAFAPARQRPGSLVAFYAVAPTQSAPAGRWLQRDRRQTEISLSLLTYAIAQGVAAGQVRSYADLAQRVRGEYAFQPELSDVTPQFEGEFNRPLLGDGVVTPRSWLVGVTGTTLVLQGGQLDFVERGAIVRVRNEHLPVQMGRFRVAEVSETSATLEPLDGFNPAPFFADADRQLRGELLQAGTRRAPTVRVAPGTGATARAAQAALRSLAQQPTGVRPAGPQEPADIVLHPGADRVWISRSGLADARFDPADRAQPPYVRCLTTEESCAAEVRTQLGLFARGERVAQLLANLGDGQVRGHLRVEQFIRHAGQREGSSCADFSPPAEPSEHYAEVTAASVSAGGTRVGHCDQIWLRVTNTGSGVIDVTPLYVSVDRAVSMLGCDTRRDEDLRLAAGETRRFCVRIRTTNGRGERYAIGTEQIALLAVEQPADTPVRSYRWLATSGATVMRDGGSDPLGAALADIDTGQSSRGNLAEVDAHSAAILLPLDVRAD